MSLITIYDEKNHSDLRGDGWEECKEYILKSGVKIIKPVGCVVDTEAIENISSIFKDTTANVDELFFYQANINSSTVSEFIRAPRLHTLRFLACKVDSQEAFDDLETEQGSLGGEKVLEIETSSLEKGSIDSLIRSIASETFPITDLRLANIPQLEDEKFEGLTNSLLANRKIVRLNLGVENLTVRMAKSLVNLIEQNKTLETLKIEYLNKKPTTSELLSEAYDRSKRFKKNVAPSKLELTLEKVQKSSADIHLVNIQKSTLALKPIDTHFNERVNDLERRAGVTEGRLESVERSIDEINNILSRITQREIEAIRKEIQEKSKDNPKIQKFYNQFFRYLQGKVIGKITNASGTTQVAIHKSYKEKAGEVALLTLIEATLLTGGILVGFALPGAHAATVPAAAVASSAVTPVAHSVGKPVLKFAIEVMDLVFEELTTFFVETAGEWNQLRKEKNELEKSNKLATSEELVGLTIQELELIYANIAKKMVFFFEDYLQDWRKSDGENLCNAFFNGTGMFNPNLFDDKKTKLTVKEKKRSLSEILLRSGAKEPSGKIIGNTVLPASSGGSLFQVKHRTEYETSLDLYRCLSFQTNGAAKFMHSKYQYIVTQENSKFELFRKGVRFSSYFYGGPDEKVPADIDRAILDAVNEKDCKLFKSLLRFQPDLRLCSNINELFFAAIEGGDVEILKILNEHLPLYRGRKLADNVVLRNLFLTAITMDRNKALKWLCQKINIEVSSEDVDQFLTIYKRENFLTSFLGRNVLPNLIGRNITEELLVHMISISKVMRENEKEVLHKFSFLSYL